MRSFSRYFALPLVVATAFACKSEEKPDAFMNATLQAANGQPRALWDALPPTYQKDVNDVVAAFAAKVPAEPWDQSFVIGGKLAQVLETKKTFVLGHPAVAQGPIKAEDITKAWDPAVRMIGALVNSEIKTVEGLKKLDVGKFMAGTMATVIKEGMATAEAAGSAIPGDGADKIAKLKAQMKDVKITVEKQEGDKATIKIVAPGEKDEMIEMVKVEGKWLPKDMVDAWPGAIASAKAGIAAITVEPAMLVQFAMMKGMITPVLDGLLAAKTQDEFNAQIDGAMKAMMGGPGGGGRPVAEADAMPGAEPSDEAEAPAEAQPVKAKMGKKKPVKKTH